MPFIPFLKKLFQVRNVEVINNRTVIAEYKAKKKQQQQQPKKKKTIPCPQSKYLSAVSCARIFLSLRVNSVTVENTVPAADFSSLMQSMKDALLIFKC